MKKLIAILFSAFMLGFSTASVAGTAIAADQNGTGEGTTVTITAASDCTLLTEDVTVNLSSGVAGGYDCIAASNTIGVATCHPNGRNDASNNNYIYTASSAGGSVIGDQTANCDSAGSAAGTAATTAAGSST